MAGPYLEESESFPVTRKAWDSFKDYFGSTKDVLTGKAVSDLFKQPDNPLLNPEAYGRAAAWQPGESAVMGSANRRALDEMGGSAQGRGAVRAAGGVWSNRFTDLRGRQAMDAAGRQAPQLGQMAWQDRAAQENLARMLLAQASGTAPSAAQMQLQQGGEQAMRQAMSLAAGQRGIGGAAALRGATQAGQASMLQANQQAAQMRAAEQAAGQQALSQHLAGMRGQEIGLAQTGAQLTQQQQAQNDAMVVNLMRQGLSEDQARAQVEQATQQMNLQSEVQQRQLNDQMTQFYMSQGLSRDMAEQKAAAELEAMRQAQALAILNSQAGMMGANVQQTGQQRGAMVGAAGGLLGALISDRRAKHKVETADKDVEDYLDSLSPQSWEYKDQKNGPGRWWGVMAQDVEKTKLGKSIVQDDGRAKRIDLTRALVASLASQANLNQRLRKLEGGR